VDTRVDIQAEYEVSSRGDAGEPEAVIKLSVEGEPLDLKLVLSSEPEMDDDDIFSYLTTGRPSGDGSVVSSGAVAELALGSVTDLVGGAAFEAAGVDVIEFEFDGFRGATVIAGQYILPELYVGFKQPIEFSEDADESSSSSKRPEFEIEYEAFRSLLLNLQGGRSGFRVFLRSRYGY